MYILAEYKIKPSQFIYVYKKNNCDIDKTLNFFFRYQKLKLNLKFNLDDDRKDELIKNNYKETLNFLFKNKIKVLNIANCKYPYILKQIYFPPPILFYKGEKIKKSKFNIAVVGTRKCTDYGIEAAEYISSQLSKIGVTIVSGLALGIDSYAQKAALKERGGSIGVMGCGIDVVYPPENKYLYEDIIRNGSIVSEFFPNTPPLKQNFPARNRIVSGLCQGVVVIEAGERSGAIITGELALKQDREVFAVPGSIFSSESRGCHKLIKSGAKLVEDIDDILEEFSNYFDLLGAKKNLNEEFSSSRNLDTHGSNRKYDRKKLSGNNDNNVYNELEEDHRKVYEFIGFRPKSLEEIVKFTNFGVKKVLQIITNLQLRQLIEEKNFNKYKRLY